MNSNMKDRKQSGHDSFAYLAGSFLYDIGFQTEYSCVKIARAFIHILSAIGHIFKWIGKTASQHLKPFFITAMQEITSPWRQAVSGIKNIHGVMSQQRQKGDKSAAQEGREYFARGVKLYQGTIKRALAYLMPVAALAVFAVTVFSVFDTNYALAVYSNGKLLGFAENEKVYSDAVSLVQSRIKSNSSERQFDIDTTLNIVSVSKEALYSKARLADAIINASGNDVAEAVGYMLDGALIGATTDGDSVQKVLDAAKAPYLDATNPNIRVEFIRNLTVQSGVYFTDTLESAQDIIGVLQGRKPYTAIDGTQQTADLLAVKQIKRIEIEREVPFEQVTENDATLEWGTEITEQEGSNGLEKVTQDITYIEGVQVSIQDVESSVITEAVPEIVRYGVQSKYGVAGEVGTGNLIWPVPDYTGVSRGMTVYHRGLDITAKAGTPIVAADNGIVEFAGNASGTANWSYGNYVKIDHGNGMTTLYGHMIAVNCTTGQYVKQGDVIGFVGSTGLSTGNHCHFETMINKKLTNPYDLVQRPS